MTTERLIDDLPTPALLVDRDRLARNIVRMQAKATENGVRLRPHAKTHRSVAVAKMQIDAGAVGLTVAKTSEAEIFVDAGVQDVRIAYVVYGEDKWRRIARLSERARVSFLIDTAESARAASKFFAEEGVEIDVLLEVDTGHHRCGVDPARADAIDLARLLHDLPGLRLVGILTHGGHGYHGPLDGESAADALLRTSNQERDVMLSLAARLRDEGIARSDFEISIGSTPTISVFENRHVHDMRITEIRPGNYVFHDAIQVGLGSCAWNDCALTVLSTVVSRHRDLDGSDRVYLDAGKKIFTTDTGYATNGFGTILYNAAAMTVLPHSKVTALSEEHGWVSVPGGSILDVGARVRVVPNHACVVASMFDTIHVVSGEHVVGDLSVDARGASQ
jgi:D-serine deaminase-like pyridoxal phosphate-dependent protein